MTQHPVTIPVNLLFASPTLLDHRLQVTRRLVLGPLALAPSSMIESPIDSPNESAFRGTIREDARIIRCTESDCDMCKNEMKEVNSLSYSDQVQL